MKIYLRKIDYQCINKQISYTHEVLEDFLDNLGDHDYIKCIGMKSGKEENVQLLLATDPRFNNSIKNILKEEGKLEEGDLMAMYKQRDSYLVELIKPNDDRYDKYMSLFGKDRHAIIHMDDETPANEVDYNTCNIYGMHATLVNNCLDETKPHVCIGWSCLGDLSSVNEDDIYSLYDENMGIVSSNRRGQDVSQINTFLFKLNKGDMVVLFDGPTRTANFGIITSDYYFEYPDGISQDRDYIHNKSVNWIKSVVYDELPTTLASTAITRKSIWNMDKYRKIIVDIISDKNEIVERLPRSTTKYPLNSILYGPPGTGKTYTTTDYAVAIIEDRDLHDEEMSKGERDALVEQYKNFVAKGQIVFTTFHQSYGYEDFIQGLRPNSDDGTLRFVPHDGIFKQIADKALRDQSSNYVIVIDEINRANISKVFGELITLIEDDKRWGEANELSVVLPSGDVFAVPNNLYIVGTMNSADKSISLIDSALRRRFQFIEVIPNPLLIKDAVIRRMFIRLNEKLVTELDSTDLLIGHAYFIGKTLDNLEDIMNQNIIPLLYEYFYDNKTKVKNLLSYALDGLDFEIMDPKVGRINVIKKG